MGAWLSKNDGDGSGSLIITARSAAGRRELLMAPTMMPECRVPVTNGEVIGHVDIDASRSSGNPRCKKARLPTDVENGQQNSSQPGSPENGSPTTTKRRHHEGSDSDFEFEELEHGLLLGGEQHPNLSPIANLPVRQRVRASCWEATIWEARIPTDDENFNRAIIDRVHDEAKNWREDKMLKFSKPRANAGLDETELDDILELEKQPKMGSSFAQTTFNALNIVVGIALLSVPYTIGQVGLLGIPILVLYAGICVYTGVLLRKCMDAYSGMRGYPDIGWAAFGPTGRIIVSIVLYVELFMLGCEQLILGGESLTAIVPHPEHIPFLAWASFVPAQTFWCLVCCVGVMPTMFVRDLTFLSYVSAAGILFTSTIVLLVGGEAATTIGAGTSEWQPFEVVNWSGVMLALSMYAFCYSGHAVFPKLYNGMSSPEQYPGMMWLSLGMATVMYIVMGLLGYGMYGKDVGDNIVVQMRVDNPGSVWGTISTVLTASLPFTKFALTMSPVTEAVEELLPMSLKESKFEAFSKAVRVGLVGLAASVALSLPFFGYVAAVSGSICSITISVILPSICYISIYRDRKPLELVIPAIVAAFGAFCAVYGTYISGSRLIQAIQGAH